MKIATKVVYDIESLQVLAWEGFEYDGPVALLKKGRETVEKNAALGQQNAIANQAASRQANERAQSALQLDLGSSTPGSLTPAATAQLAADRANIGRVYNGMRANAFATMGARGFGSQPSGFANAAQNALQVGQEGAETGAYRNAQVGTQNQRNFATNEEVGIAGQQGQLGNAALNGSTQAAVDRSKMGSTAGDIIGGIAEAAPIIAAPFTGGASLLGAGLTFSNPFSKLGKSGSGVGQYGTPGIVPTYRQNDG